MDAQETKPLTVHEKHFAAMALFGMAMRSGPSSFHVVQSVAGKIGVMPEFLHYAKDWIVHAKLSNQQPGEGMPGF